MAKTRASIAAVLLAAMVSLASFSSSALASGKIDQIRVVYESPKVLAHEKLREELKAAQIFEKMRKILSPLRLPRRLTLKVTGCDGARNAWYEDGVVSICYDYLAFIVDNAAKAPNTFAISAKAAWIGAVFDLVLHEVGHAVFDLLKIPIFGREEDAADMFSAYIMLQFAPADARNLIAGTAFLAASEAREWREERLKKLLIETDRDTLRRKTLASEHSLLEQRYFNLLCITYGADPKTFSHALTHGGLPKERAEGCDEEYKQVKYAFETLIKPHTDQRLAKRIRAKNWFNF